MLQTIRAVCYDRKKGSEMSLDVYLYLDYHITLDKGKTLEPKTKHVFGANITHNLGKMADEAGIYKACWRPEEIGATKAKDILPLLEKGYEDMKARPEYFKKFNSENGWGLYKNFLPWVKNYLEACKKYPKARIEISR